MNFNLKSGTAFAALLIGATAVNAAEATQNKIDDIDEIIVEGRYLSLDKVNSVKTPTPIIDVPQSLSIISANQIIRQGFDSIADITLYTPGVNSSQGEGHRDAVVFRGVRSTAAFFIDGVRDDVQYYRSLYNLEQVEILRGPNALLFGRGGTGGVLNRVTKKGVLGENFLGYQAGVDTFGAFNVQFDNNYAINDKVAFRLNAYYENLNNHRDFFGGDRVGINPTVKFELSPETVVNLSYEYLNNERFIDRGIPAQNGRPARQLANITFGDRDQNTTTFKAHVLRANVEHQFSDSLKGNFNAFYGSYDKLYSNLFPVGFDAATNNVSLDGYVDTTQRKNFQLSANLVGEYETGGINHTILFGGEFIETVNNNDRFNSFFNTSQDDVEIFRATRPINIRNGVGVNAAGVATRNSFTTNLNDDTEADLTVFSLYLQDQIEVTDYLDVVIGGRFDSFDITVDNVKTRLQTGNADIRSRKDTEFSPRLGLILKPQENISIYGSFSESFIPRSGEQFANINPPADALAPNTFQTIEAGLKWDFTETMSFTIAFFENEQSSPQVSDNDPATLDVIDSKVRGFEAQILGTVTEDFFITAGYSYLDGNRVNNRGVQGNRLRELPKHTFNVWANYQVTDEFGIGAGLTHQGESFVNNSNSVTLPSFVRIDAAAYYDVSENIRLQVNIENLTDTQYFPNSHSTHNITVGAPLNARFSISGRF